MGRIRELPYRFYERRKDEIVARTLERMKLHTSPRVEINEKEMKKHIHSIFEKARSLKDVEFEIQKDELAEELISPLKPQALSENSHLTRKIEAFLLSPEIIPLLEERLECGE
jgi:predicted metal-dependent RNase